MMKHSNLSFNWSVDMQFYFLADNNSLGDGKTRDSDSVNLFQRILLSCFIHTFFPCLFISISLSLSLSLSLYEDCNVFLIQEFNLNPFTWTKSTTQSKLTGTFIHSFRQSFHSLSHSFIWRILSGERILLKDLILHFIYLPLWMWWGLKCWNSFFFLHPQRDIRFRFCQWFYFSN